MMEMSHSLTLNEQALSELKPAQRPIFIFEWLHFLDKILEAAQKSDIKECQKQLVTQLVGQMNEAPGPPTRKLLARCLATVFSIGDTFLLFDTINKCNDILKNKDDSPSYLPTRLAAVTCIGAMYEKLGRMMGRSYEETTQILIKTLKNAESQLRIEIMLTLKKVTAGMGSAASNVHKDIYKVAKIGLTDRALPVRSVSANCLLELVSYAPFLYTSEAETLAQVCYRAFDNANYEVRCSVAKLLGTLLATTQTPPKEILKGTSKGGPIKLPSLEEALNVLLTGFLRGSSSFLKGTGEIIKGSSSVSREVRVGITQAYVLFIEELGSLWLERNLSLLLNHLTELVSSPKATSSHVEAVYSRKCVSFILRATIGKMLGEKSQTSACKELTHLVIKQMNTVDASGESKDSGEGSQHVLICLLQELGCLTLTLSTTSASLVLDTHLNLLDAVVAVLLHPNTATRLAAAWCLRCICLSLPSQLHPLLTRCCDRLESLKSSPEAISGYSFVIAALIGCVRDTPLGIPHRTGKEIFNIGEELLRSASQNSRLSIHRTTAGWLIIGSLMTLGVGVVRGLLPRMLLLWKNSFPRSSKEIESEKARGDAFTWQITLEGRAGALASIHSFLLFCPELAGDDTIRRLLSPIEAAVHMLSSIAPIVKQYGQNLKASAAMVRLRLYEVLSLLPQQSFESHFTSVLKLLVSEFTLAESAASTTTSLLRTVCHSDDSVILGSWLHETDQKYIEEQLQPNSASGSGALEHDVCYLYRPFNETENAPGPLPLGVAVIDASVTLFGKMFPLVANKHRLKMLNLFGEMIRAGKNHRQEAVQTNIFTAVLCALKRLSEHKGSLNQEDVKKAAADLVLGGLTHPNPMLRCASGEAIGRMAQVVGDPKFVAEMAQNSFDKLRSARDVVSRTGHSLALGCLHRYVGGMGSGQHLSTSISILLALAKDTSSPTVQVWSLHALSLIADSGGPMFRSYIEPSLSLLLELLLTVPPHAVEVHQCIGKCLQALITTVGPELQGSASTVVMARSSLLCGCGLVQEHYDPTVQAEAVTCLQQMHMFAPRHVNLSSLVPSLVLKSRHLLLRRAAVSCLRQLSQREAWEVCEHALSYTNNLDESPTGFVRIENGLPGILFNLLDTEMDKILEQHIHHAITSMLLALATSQLSLWLTICREVLTSATDTGNENENEGGAEGENDDDMAQIHAGGEPDPHPAIPPRWRTRVFAATCVAKIITECGNNRAHFDLALAREMQSTKMKGDFLVLHLSEIVRMGFMAATSDSDQLRLKGFLILNFIIEKFAKSPDPEFSALRPAFAPETASHVTAKACEVCSAWIGSGVARNLNDLRRVHQLLVTSLTKLCKGNTKGIYNESAVTLEKLAILKAWSEIYIVSLEGPSQSNTVENGSESLVDTNDDESLLVLVMPELISLSRYWLAALKDHALLSLPPEFSSQLPHDGGAFYTNETAEVVRICFEWLCSPTHCDDPNRSVMCLKALETLLQSQVPSSIIGANVDLAIEIATVMHRQVLSSEYIDVHQSTISVVSLLVKNAQTALEEEKKRKKKENPSFEDSSDSSDVDMLGEGGETGDINISQSLVCLSTLVRYLPKLAPQVVASAPSLLSRPRFHTKPLVVEKLLTSTLNLLTTLPDLCSPAGAVAIFPSILFLVTGVLREVGKKGRHSKESRVFPLDLTLQETLKTLCVLAKHPYSRDLRSSENWCSLLQSALATIIDLSDNENETDEVVVLEGVAELILNSPENVGRPHNLQYPIMNLFKMAMQNTDIEVCIKAVSTLEKVFNHSDAAVSTPYIHSLAPRILEQLSDTNLTIEKEKDLQYFVECTKAIELLVPRTLDQHKSEIIGVLVGIFVGALQDTGKLKENGSIKEKLHNYALSRLQKLGPEYPQEFRIVLTSKPELRVRLEMALKFQQEKQRKAEHATNIPTAPHNPTIKLKTDFSNFANNNALKFCTINKLFTCYNICILPLLVLEIFVQYNSQRCNEYLISYH
ncbi:HEAT repeat-containing protein 5B [Armadillidium nasatum]|uniref:HEAT repeat-containing protein 5A n=1 Tax=Armadillidium nasatum TaxID=96803 RepID=A0A5N5SXK0_9CRUS|nr:HEAT repeat-containing protein 5B [Armadillidium nasatum]